MIYLRNDRDCKVFVQNKPGGTRQGGQPNQDKFVYLEVLVRVASPTRINLEEPIRVASPTRINLEEPVRVASPTRINSFFCPSVRL